MASANMRSGRHRRRLVNEINVVPYIDVMLVLLVIFMVTAPMITTGVVDVPRAGKASAPPDTYAQVTVPERGQLTLRLHDPKRATETRATSGASDPDGRSIPRDDARALATAIRTLREEVPDLPVLIAAEKGVRYEAVMNVMAELQKQDVRRIALSVRQP